MKRWKSFAAALLAAALLLTAGCSTGAPDTGKTAMGRYMETEYAFPGKIFSLLNIRAADAGIDALCYMELEGQQIELNLLQSADGGASWKKQAAPWIDAFNAEEASIVVDAAAWDHNGGMYLYCSDQAQPELPPFLSYIDPQGTQSRLPWQPPESPDGSGIHDIQVAENGDLLMNHFFSLLQVDSKTGAVKHTLLSNATEAVTVLAYGDTAAASYGNSIHFYSLDSGMETETLSCAEQTRNPSDAVTADAVPGDASRIMAKGADGALYFADRRGLFRWNEGSPLQEQLIDGTLTSLNTPSLSRVALVVDGERFLAVCFADSEFKLLSYGYRADVPTLPETELKVYALEDNATVRQAMGTFQRQNPSVYISFQMGLSGEAVTRSDALRVLAAELLAGKGPDVLVLDGLPIDSYRDKGVLLDLASFINEEFSSGLLLSNVAETYREADGALPAVPARFQVPMMQGFDETIDAADNLGSLADWLEQNRSSYYMPLHIKDYQQILALFYPVCASFFTNEDGSIDADGLNAFLRDTKRIYDLLPPNNDGWDYHPNYAFDCMSWMKNFVAVNIGTVSSFDHIYAPWQAMKNMEEGKAAPLFYANLFLPQTVLGVNAGSAHVETAKAFLACALSEPVQRYNFDDGMPVNEEAFSASVRTQNERGTDRFSFYGSSVRDETGKEQYFTLNINFPPKEYQEEMQALFRSLTPPPQNDSTILEILQEGADAYFQGTRSLADTMDSLLQKIRLYQAQG